VPVTSRDQHTQPLQQVPAAPGLRPALLSLHCSAWLHSADAKARLASC
jgi:hypothetical protein